MQRVTLKSILSLHRRLRKIVLSLLSLLFLIGCKLDFPEQW